MTSLEKILAKSKELRDKATPLPWDDKPATESWKQNKDANAELARHAVNTASAKDEMLQVMWEALDKIVDPPEYLENGGDAYSLYCNLLANKALARIEELAAKALGETK